MVSSPLPDDPSLYNVRLRLPAAMTDGQVSLWAAALDDDALASSALRENNEHRAPWVVTWIVDFAPDLPVLAARFHDALAARGLPPCPAAPEDWSAEPVPAVNWLAHSYQQFQPFPVGRFFIYGSHYDGVPPPDLTGLLIDAATAFGSGEHGTTAGCLRAMLTLAEDGFRPRHALDMGTGSGILAIAAVKLWGCPVLATDIDEEAVRVTARHAEMNGTAAAMSCVAGDGFAAPAVGAGAPYDLVLANILAGPLIDMAADLCRATAPGGYAILSGILEEQADEVLAAYRPHGLTLRQRYDSKGWTATLLHRA